VTRWRGRGALVAAALVTAFLAGTAGAGAGIDGPDVDDSAARDGLVISTDLPDGYELETVRRDTGAYARFLDVQGDCDRINTAATFTDAKPVTSRAEFADAGTTSGIGGQGIETVFAFDDEDDAQEYYRRFAPAFAELVDCGLMTDAAGNIGTYSDLSVGKVGDQRTALAFAPRADRYTRIALVRSGENVLYVELYDDAVTDAEFTALVKRATKRAR